MKLVTINEKFAKDTWEERNKCPWRFMRSDAPLPATLQSEEEYYRLMSSSNDCMMYAIVEDGIMVGAVKLRENSELSYYMLRPEYEHRGLMKRAIKEVLDTAFLDPLLDGRFNFVYAWVNPCNAASYCMLVKLGFKVVGISLINPNVHRLELARSSWKKRK